MRVLALAIATAAVLSLWWFSVPRLGSARGVLSRAGLILGDGAVARASVTARGDIRPQDAACREPARGGELEQATGDLAESDPVATLVDLLRAKGDVVAGCGSAAADDPEDERVATECVPEDAVLEEEVLFRDYGIRIWRGGANEERALEILWRGRRAYCQRAPSGFLILREPPRDDDAWPWGQGAREQNRAAWVGNDVTGDGQPDLVVVRVDRGSRCPDAVHVFELGAKFRHATTVEAWGWRYEDLDRDGTPELVAVEPCEYCIRREFAPRVVLRFRSGKYDPAPDLMRRPASDFSDWHTVADRLRIDPGWDRGAKPIARPPMELVRDLADMVYAGQPETAQALLDRAWPESVAGKQQFVLDFVNLLAHEYMKALYASRP